MQPDERVIVEAERAAELDQAVQQRPDQCPSTRESQLQRRHDHHEQNCRKREPQARSPQRSEFTVAEADRDRIAAGEDGAHDEGGQHLSLTVPGHGRPLPSDRTMAAVSAVVNWTMRTGSGKGIVPIRV